MQAWLDASGRVDDKWKHVLGEVLPTAQAHVARVLGLTSGSSIAFAPNTHELLGRLFSCFETGRPVSILTTDGEFLSFTRQAQRWEEAGLATWTRIPVEPFETFARRFLDAAAQPVDLVFVSQVFFRSGFVFEAFERLADIVPRRETFVVIDGYHGFMARPTSLAAVEDRVFYLAGGYKYAMAGEGTCFMHCPAGYGSRPVDTGWFAGFGELARLHAGDVGYPVDGMRFFGSTFDPSGLYRFNAVLGRWQDLGVSVADFHDHVVRLQQQFLSSVAAHEAGPLRIDELVPAGTVSERGNFLTFRRRDVAALHLALRAKGVMTDHRGDRIRFGFAPYHDSDDIVELARRLAS